MNKQPFYHRATVLFTATEEMSERGFEKMLRNLIDSHYPDIIATSIEVEEWDEPEAGNPADLM